MPGIKEIISFKLYGETFADVHVYTDGDKKLAVYRRHLMSRDEALLLADFITQNVR